MPDLRKRDYTSFRTVDKDEDHDQDSGVEDNPSQYGDVEEDEDDADDYIIPTKRRRKPTARPVRTLNLSQDNPSQYGDVEDDEDNGGDYIKPTKRRRRPTARPVPTSTLSQDKPSEYGDVEEHEDDGGDYIIPTKRRRRPTARPVPTSILSQDNLYSYRENMTDKRKRAQDERNFAEASKLEKRISRRENHQPKIRFDRKGNLYYNANTRSDSTPWEPAVFHHWLREELVEEADRRGSYAFRRRAGPGLRDTTSYVDSQRTWGEDRPNYAPVMFEYEPPQVIQPRPPLSSWYHNGKLVIDYWLRPLHDFQDIPAALSSEFEGAFMEPAQRLDSRLTHQDFRARMPPFIVEGGIRPVWDTNNLSKRNRLFRAKAGAITWTRPNSRSAKIKEYVDSIHATQRPGRRGNDTHGCQDLTKKQITELLNINKGAHSNHSRTNTVNTPAETADTSEAEVEESAEVAKSNTTTRVTRSQKKVEGESKPTEADAEPHRSSTLKRKSREGDTEGPRFSKSRRVIFLGDPSAGDPQTSASSARVADRPSIDAVLQRLRSRQVEAPQYRLERVDKDDGTELYAAPESDKNDNDGKENDSDHGSVSDGNTDLYIVPDTPSDVDFIQTLLKPTLRHYRHLTNARMVGYDRQVTYVEQYEQIEASMRTSLMAQGRPAPILIGLVEYNERRAVWNQRWDWEVFGDPPELDDCVEEQLDSEGLRL